MGPEKRAALLLSEIDAHGHFQSTNRGGFMSFLDVDVIVVGGGNAGFTAAHAAAVRGRSVIILERGEGERAGGNSVYTAGATRIAHNGLKDLQTWVEPDERHPVSEVPPYSADEYRQDLERVTLGRTDPELADALVNEAGPALRWLRSLGMRYRLMYERQSYERPDGTYLFWGGLHVGNVDGGEGLMRDHVRIAGELGIDVRYGHRARELLRGVDGVEGVVCEHSGGTVALRAESVILASGGFESNPDLRAEHLGERWRNARIRGTAYNMGDMHKAAMAIGAAPGGDWSTCHSVQWDAWFAENESNRVLTNRLTRQSYPLGILVNTSGDRFLDEGADFRNYTYAKYGKVILEQPESLAFQIFDAQTYPSLRTEEYNMPGISVVSSDTIEGLAELMAVPASSLRKTVDDFNASIDREVPYDPTVKDGLKADVVPPKSNWATPLEEAPFYAYPVTCGITFTFGGLKTDPHGRVLTAEGSPIPRLFAAGEMLGGLFSTNYPGGSGLAAGCVFGRRAGSIA